MLEEMLDVMLIELGATHEQFLSIAAKGLENENDKKYYEQLIACDNFLYFKNMMIKRNIQLEGEAFDLMMEKEKKNDAFKVDPAWRDMQKLKEQNELECAIAMSLALEEEKRKLRELEEEQLKVFFFN